MTDKYDEQQVLESLRRKSDVRVLGKMVYVLRGSMARGDLGNGSKAKIDYLLHYKGYSLQWATRF